MNREETRVVDPVTGGAKGQKLARAHLIPASTLLTLMEHYGLGEDKYPSDPDGTPNYTKGYPWSLSYDAALRHLLLFWSGEDNDPETGTPHVLCAAWHCLALNLFAKTHPEKDDRWEGRDADELTQWQDALDAAYSTNPNFHPRTYSLRDGPPGK